ncbi:MAG TPA: methyl-accepting chemotaxis protein [Usitatibacteraceae bacterium]|nr:methyl-accepting chemotaxis protein [Usitatibacteraceae bacterium]
MKMLDLKIAHRVTLAFAGVVATILLTMAAVQVGLGRSADNSAAMGAGVERQALASEMHLAAKDNAIASFIVLVSPDEAQQKRLMAEIEQREVKIAAALASLEKSLAGSKEDEEILAEVKKRHATSKAGVQRILGLVKAGKQSEAAFAADEEMIPMIAPFLQALAKLDARQVALVREKEKENGTLIATTRGISFGAGAVAAILAALAGLWLVVSITRPLARAVRFAEKVSAGDLTAHEDVRGGDEISVLLREMNRMSEALSSLVSQVRASADNIATGSTEIAAGTQDLSIRTERQAASLEQTSASMAELTDEVKKSADSAQKANELASAASTSAAGGGEVVDRVVKTMESITTQSHKIAEIITVIDGIAFQTNILALNAAVEAARAGEQGRGFAVVASEVRNLAQRSAQAAREIKDLITASVEQIETGGRLVHEAGDSMHEIVAHVKRVTDLIGEVTLASRHEGDGIGQINDAVTELDKTTQQNAALVEQSAAAADSLKIEAQRLAESVSRFRIAGAGPGHAQPG